MDKKSKIIAFTGKGGSGKTALAAITARCIIQKGYRRILLIDADSAIGLTYTLKGKTGRTVGDIREEIISNAMSDEKIQIEEMLDYMLAEAIVERENYSLLTMGNMNTKGCFCPLNKVLRMAIQELSASFDYIIVDGEAGVEQINRQVLERIDTAVIVTDGSIRGMRVAGRILEIVRSGENGLPGGIGVVINKSNSEFRYEKNMIPELDLQLFGVIPFDKFVLQYDSNGISLFDLPDNSPALKAVSQMIDTMAVCR